MNNEQGNKVMENRNTEGTEVNLEEAGGEVAGGIAGGIAGKFVYQARCCGVILATASEHLNMPQVR